MELALYCPLCGYYEQEADKVGRRGDYFTSVSVGCLFGELLAFQFADWLDALRVRAINDQSRAFHIIEAGAHDGRLAKDILGWFEAQRPELLDKLEYWIIEPSMRRRGWQQGTLVDYATRVRWFDDATSVFAFNGPVTGIVFSNELLDALPVRRLGWDARARGWFEWGITLDGDRYAWARLCEAETSSKAIADLMAEVGLHPSPELLAALPDEFTIEVCPTATKWWRDAARLLGHGKLVTFDYGLETDEVFAPHRRNGTLRAYRQHRVSNDALACAGEQDLTAHVNFTALRSAGEGVGLITESLTTQGQFLVNVAEKAWRDPAKFGEWTPERLRQFKTLTHPEHLGCAFRVLTQSRAG